MIGGAVRTGSGETWSGTGRVASRTVSDTRGGGGARGDAAGAGAAVAAGAAATVAAAVAAGDAAEVHTQGWVG